MTRSFFVLSGLAWVSITACGVSDGNGAGTCPGEMVEALVTCDAPECQTTQGQRWVGVASLDRSVADRWYVLATAASDLFTEEDDEIQNLDLTVDYGLDTPGGLTPRGKSAGRFKRPGVVWSPEQQARIQALRRRQAAENLVHGAAAELDRSRRRFSGTALRPAGISIRQQGQTCTSDAPDCGSGALCLLPPGESEGMCADEVELKLAEFGVSGVEGFRTIRAQIRQVGEEVAVLVDQTDTVSESDVAAIVDRFDRHIAPLDHAFFGRPDDGSGRDFDRNGVVTLLLTSQVGQVSPLGADLVGFFLSDDLIDVSMPGAPAHSNGSDILYMQPPGPGISLDALSGTIGHEYQHLINYTSKVLRQSSERETVWLDEGISTFAEEMLGYGIDAFDNIALYLASASSTSLNGAGFVPGDPDSSERRGMAALLVRYLFEQSGGASFDGPGGVTDGGGVAAVRRLVQSPDTGAFLFSASQTGRDFDAWLEDLVLTASLDGTDIEGVSCEPRFQLQAPEVDAFTGGQRGIDLRGSVPGLGNLTGPAFDPFAPGQTIPIVLNGGDFRILNLDAQTAQVRLVTDAETADTLQLRLRVVPAR